MAFESPRQPNPPFIATTDEQMFASVFSVSFPEGEPSEEPRQYLLENLDIGWQSIERKLALSRLYYYHVEGGGSSGQEHITREVLNNINSINQWTRFQTNLDVKGLYVRDRRVYVPLVTETSSNETKQFKISAVVVFRVGSPVAVLRVKDDDYLEGAEVMFNEITGPSLNSPELVNFNWEFHRRFEQRYINKYSELWIDVEKDENLNKVHLTSNRFGDARYSDIAEQLLADAPKNRITTGQVTLTNGTTLYFQWDDSRTSVRSKDNAVLEDVADYIRNTLVVFTNPPTVRVVNLDDRPIRVETYEGYYAASWSSSLTLDGLIDIVEINFDAEAQMTVITEDDEVGQGLWNDRDEAFSENKDLTFLRVDSQDVSVVWERREGWSVVSVIADNDVEYLNDIYDQVEDRTISSDAQEFVFNYVTEVTEE